MVVRKYVIPILAIAGVAVAVYTVRSENKPIEPAPPVSEPARSPFAYQVAGAGIVESSTQNIAIGTNVAGIVARVFVQAGDSVKAGEPLFMIDDRASKAELAVRKAALTVAEKSLSKLEQSPRAEDVPPAEARVRAARSQADEAGKKLSMWESVKDPRAVSEDLLTARRFAFSSAEARLAEEEAALIQLKAGAWAPEKDIARAEVESARAQERAAETEIERLTVRAPVDGHVLQLNIRAGEFAQAGALTTPLLLLGNVDVLHVRVDVDENDAWRIRRDARARATLRGNSELGTDLTFVRIEPYVVPKRSLTGDSAERVDTRVLQVIYAFTPGSLPAYVGQQMDVYIDAAGAEVKP